VRIGIEMVAVQSPWSRLRGIGRFSYHFVTALLAQAPEVEFVLYVHDGLPTDRVPHAPNARTVLLRREPEHGEQTLHDVMDRLARRNPDHLDLLLPLSPMELYGGYGPPAKPLNSLALATVVYDLIPFVFQEDYLDHPPSAIRLYDRLQDLKRYDVLLAISEATRADVFRLLGLPADRVVTIHCASEDRFFEPDRAEPLPLASAKVLRRLGIDRPFIFNLGGMDERNDRKNLFGLIDAFGLLPEPLRQSHQLVISCFMNEAFAGRLRRRAGERGIENRLILTNEIDDETLRVLYQRCAVFAFVSFYEGFGLPLLEAMQCGAAVVGGNNSSQIEVIGDAGLLANTHDPADIAAKLEKVLSNRAVAADLRKRAVEQAKKYSWEKTARTALEAIGRAVETRKGRRLRVDRSHAPKPRLAVFSPFPPKVSGISDYIVQLLAHWKEHYAIDLFHEVGYVPDLGLSSHEFGCHDYRLFERLAAIRPYRGIIYQMGNSVYHRFVYETLLRHPGIITLHDFCLSAFQYWWAHLPGTAPDAFEHEIKHCCPDRAAEIISQLGEWAQEPGGIQVACARRGLYLNRRVFEHARAVIVHSPWCIEQVRDLFPQYLDRTVHIPQGAQAEPVTPERRAKARDRFDLPREALVFGSFGILSGGKMNTEAIEAFAVVARAHPSALFLFVGADWDQGAARRKAETLGLERRVRFLGRQPAPDFADLIAATDIGVSLRRPPTDGETSGALLHLLRLGVATIVTDVGTFADYPDTVVRKVRWETEGLPGLQRAMAELAAYPERRAALGQAAWALVAERHAWDRVARLYEDVIEQVAEPRGAPEHSGRSVPARGPHRGLSDREPTCVPPRP
jgi:glycosyltransferase involved in cell wall biosynthesis